MVGCQQDAFVSVYVHEYVSVIERGREKSCCFGITCLLNLMALRPKDVLALEILKSALELMRY